ncbi:MAG: hypothetical protein M3443_13460 [Actinomycetota bacterium]|nr:hypothetical protein [Actinomycetota bacterium]
MPLHGSADAVPDGTTTATATMAKVKSANSTFRVYYADPYSPLWCYGYSVQIARTGYILCEAYD